MSNEAINWAFQTTVGRAADKAILVAMANMADCNGQCYPSQKCLADQTELDPKTVAVGFVRLREKGLITDTGQRRGATSQVVVWKLACQETPPKTEGEEKRESPPIFPGKDTVFPVEAPQFSGESPPKTGDGTQRETTKETKEETTVPAPAPIADLFPAPEAPKPPKVSRPKVPRVKPRTECPPDWYPDPAGIEFARERCVDPKAVVPQFRDWHLAKGSLMADWSAAWRTWCQNQVRFAAERGTVRSKPPKPSGAENAKFMEDLVNGTLPPETDYHDGLTIDARDCEYVEA